MILYISIPIAGSYEEEMTANDINNRKEENSWRITSLGATIGKWIQLTWRRIRIRSSESN